jgi:hypothetical protein
MKTLVYCYNVEGLDLIGTATEAVRKYEDVVPAVGDIITSRNDVEFEYEYWLVVKRIFNHKGAGTLDLILNRITYKDLYII